MPTTTNYGWTTPADTDLVKDGAAAIRTLGSSADTTVKNLNPGTTAGDIDYYTSSTAKAKVAIGTAGQVLRVNSGATAPEWHTPAAAGSETLLSTTSLSGTSTTISSISGAYKHLRIWIFDIDITSATSAQFRFRFNGDTAANYPNFYTGSDAVNKADNTIGYLTNDRAHSVTASETSIILDVYHYSNTDAYKPFQSCGIYLDHTASAYYAETSAGGYASTSAIDSFTILTASAQAFTGTVKIYGVN